VRADARFRHLPAWRARETYGQFVGRLGLRDGVLVELARHMLHLQVRGPTTHAAPAGEALGSHEKVGCIPHATARATRRMLRTYS
jgi:hypothetical protein